MLLVTALASLITIAGAQSAGPTAADAPAPPAPPAQSTDRASAAAPLSFTPAVLDLGEMTAGERKTGKLTVRNTSASAVKITRVVPACGCTTLTTVPTEPLQPGASFTVDITVNPGAKAGISLSKVVTFQVEGSNAQVLTVTGHVNASPGAPPASPVAMLRLPAANVGDAVERRRAEAAQDDLIFAIDRQIAKAPRSAEFRLKLHRETGMLFVQGSAAEVALVKAIAARDASEMASPAEGAYWTPPHDSAAPQ